MILRKKGMTLWKMEMMGRVIFLLKGKVVEPRMENLLCASGA